MDCRDEAESILREEGCPERIITHSDVVCDYATEVARRAHADVSLVECAVMLHDIGRSRTHEISHGVVGADILRRRRVDERVCLAVERHVGAGISMQEAELLGLPKKDYIPQTLEEKIVCMADSLYSEERRIPVEELLSYYRRLGLNESVRRFEKMYEELHEWL